MALELLHNPAPRSAIRGPRCVHHWILEAADGAQSLGRCKHCAAERCFSNHVEFDSWSSARDERHVGASAARPPLKRLDLADDI